MSQAGLLVSGSSGTASTIGAVTGDAITLSLGAVAATYAIEARVAGFEPTTPAGAGYKIFGTVRTDGLAATLIGTPDVIVNEEAALAGADATLVVAANTAIIQVTGVALLTIRWNAQAQYTAVI